MHISNISTSYLIKELQSGAGLSANTASGAGQNPPSDIDSADSSGAASPIKASDLGSSQFAADTLSSLLSVQTSPGSNLASKLIGDLDSDGDGALSQDEVAKAVGSSSSDISDKFAKLDGDGDGKLSQDELTGALDSFLKASGPHHGHHHGGMAKHEASDLIDQLDTNGDGTVSLDELNAGAGTTTASTTTSTGAATTTDASSTGATSADATSTTATTIAATGSSDMAKTFASLDANGDGQLNMDELTKAFAQAMAQQHRFAKPFWEAASTDPSTTTSATQSVTA